jgi:hypothetical protein
VSVAGHPIENFRASVNLVFVPDSLLPTAGDKGSHFGALNYWKPTSTEGQGELNLNLILPMGLRERLAFRLDVEVSMRNPILLSEPFPDLLHLSGGE